MINSLTPEQKAQLPVYRDKWLRIGLSTAKCDRAKAEDAARRAYAIAGLAPPSQFVWFKSPLSLAVGASARNSIEEPVKDSVLDSVEDAVWDFIEGAVDDAVRAYVWASLDASVVASVKNAVENSVWESVWPPAWASVRESAYGSQDSHWLCVFDYFRGALGLRCCDRLVPLMDLAENCGWWIPRENVCFMSEKPIFSNLKDGVIVYSDGFRAES